MKALGVLDSESKPEGKEDQDQQTADRHKRTVRFADLGAGLPSKEEEATEMVLRAAANSTKREADPNSKSTAHS